MCYCDGGIACVIVMAGLRVFVTAASSMSTYLKPILIIINIRSGFH